MVELLTNYGLERIWKEAVLTQSKTIVKYSLGTKRKELKTIQCYYQLLLKIFLNKYLYSIILLSQVSALDDRLQEEHSFKRIHFKINVVEHTHK